MSNRKVSVIWRRGKSYLESNAGEINPMTKEAMIDESQKMTTQLEYDTVESKFLSKMSFFELVFYDSKEQIGFHEFDIGQYANRLESGKTDKRRLDLKSDRFPGCQIYLYVNIQVLEDLPAPRQSFAGATGAGKDQKPAASQPAQDVLSHDPEISAL